MSITETCPDDPDFRTVTVLAAGRCGFRTQAACRGATISLLTVAETLLPHFFTNGFEMGFPIGWYLGCCKGCVRFDLDPIPDKLLDVFGD